MGGDHLDGRALYDDVRRLAALGPRFAGTDGDRVARDIVRAALSDAGVGGVRAEPLEFLGYEAGPSLCRIEAPERDPLPVRCTGLQGTASGQAAGPAIPVGSGSADEIARARAAHRTLRGAVVVVSSGVLFPVAERLRDEGIAALVHVAGTAGGLIGDFTATFYPPRFDAVLPFPGISIGAADGERLLAAIASGRVDVRVGHAARHVRRTSVNLSTEVPGTDPDAGTTVVGAHYDSQRESPGASDNATGIAVLIALVRDARARPRARTLRFVAFAAEELGAWGATHHVRSADHRAITAMMNLDALGAPLDARRSIIATPDLHELARAASSQAGWHAAETIDAADFPYTDMAPFVDAGIPSCMLWRYPPPHPYYHSEGDTPEHVDPRRLVEDARAIRAVLDALAGTSYGVRCSAAR